MEWDDDVIERNKKLKKTIVDFNKRIQKLIQDREDLDDMYKNELKVKNLIIETIKADTIKYKKLCQELTMKLQVPRTHMLFL